jgi:hypothetical protein
MVISNDTAMNIYRVLTKNCSAKQIRSIIEDLAEVPGNQSFRDTVNRLRYIHDRKSAGELREPK